MPIAIEVLRMRPPTFSSPMNAATLAERKIPAFSEGGPSVIILLQSLVKPRKRKIPDTSNCSATRA